MNKEEIKDLTSKFRKVVERPIEEYLIEGNQGKSERKSEGSAKRS